MSCIPFAEDIHVKRLATEAALGSSLHTLMGVYLLMLD